MEALDDFYTDHPFVDWYMTTQDEGYSQHFSKKKNFGGTKNLGASKCLILGE